VDRDIRLGNTKQAVGDPQFLPDAKPTGYGDKISASLDELRKVGREYLRKTYGIFNPVVNGSVELDAVNSNPTTVLGTAIAGWTATGTTSSGSTVRQVTTVSGASPFGAGGKSMRFIDNTTGGTGTRLDFTNSFATPLSNNVAPTLSFDFRLNATGTANAVGVRPFAKNASNGDISGCTLLLNGNATTGNIYDGKKGRTVATVTVGTWYRVIVDMPAPGSAGTTDATLYLTPWNGSGPGATTSYAVGSFGSSLPTGVSRVYFNTSAPSQSTDINVDNVMLQMGE
jgi:hypothetical protein